MQIRKIAFLLIYFVFFIFSTSVNAATIIATEVIEDLDPVDLFNRNMSVTRTDSNGFFQNITGNANVVAQNQVSNSFGIYDFFDVTYNHVMSWINPLASSYVGLTLEIKAYGVDGGNEVVFADTLNLGALKNDGLPILEGNTTTLFTNNNSAVLNAILIDGILAIKIDKNSGASGLGLLDPSSIFYSKLTIEYTPVPEPLTAGLLLSSLVALKHRRRKLA